MSYFLLRLNAPRPTFIADMTDDELQIMRAHAGYWAGLCERGIAIAYGPVNDPAGGWGVGLLEIDDAEAAAALSAQDPAILSGRGFSTDILPMPRLIVRAGAR